MRRQNKRHKCLFCNKIASFKLKQMMEQLKIDAISISQNPNRKAEKIIWTKNRKWICGNCLRRISKLNAKFSGVLGEVLRGLEFYKQLNKFALISTNAYGEKSKTTERRIKKEN